jgi:Fe-S-cluster containining protein
MKYQVYFKGGGFVTKREGCDCPECQECCEREAGWFMPDEIATAAEFLGISEREFVADYLEEHLFNGAVVLSPKMRKGGCLFLEKGLCRIHPVKPYECRKVYGCQGGRRHKRIREIIAKKWR